MKTKFYLTVNDNGTVKATRKAQNVSINEVCMGFSLDLPDVLFRRPQIEASVTVDAKDVAPFQINADTSNMVKEAIKQSTGLEVKLTVVNPETELTD